MDVDEETEALADTLTEAMEDIEDDFSEPELDDDLRDKVWMNTTARETEKLVTDLTHQFLRNILHV